MWQADSKPAIQKERKSRRPISVSRFELSTESNGSDPLDIGQALDRED